MISEAVIIYGHKWSSAAEGHLVSLHYLENI